MKNPLRYPGAKSKLFDYVKKLLEVEGLKGFTFYEPFAGSASLSWMLLEENVVDNVVINEKDPLLYHFWKAVFENTEGLIPKIEQTEISIDTWKECAQYKELSHLIGKTSVEIGYAGLFLNRTNFSGILKANPIGGIEQKSNYKIDCRFNKRKVIEAIQSIARFANRVTVSNEDTFYLYIGWR